MASLRAAVVAARQRLSAAGIDEPQIEAELLLRYALEVASGADEALARPSSASGRAVSRTQLYTQLEENAPAEVEAAFESFLARRLAHEPSAYITGRTEFRGLELALTQAVLVPRPETEGLVEAVLRELGRTQYPGLNPEPSERAAGLGPQARRSSAAGRAGRLCVVDVGTGSGAIAVALAQALPRAEVYATDVSREALAVAAENARRHGLERRLALRHGDLLAPLQDYVECIIANLPYVTSADWSRLEPELREYEPRLALDGGADGLDLVRALLTQAPRYLRPGGLVALEIGEEQAAALGRFIEEALPGAAWRVEQDFAGKDRYCLVST